MTDTAIPAARPEKLSLGRTIQGAFGVLRRNFATFLLLILTSVGAPAVLMIVSGVGLGSGAGVAAFGLILGGLGLFAGFVVLQAGMIHATVADLNGRRSSFSDSLSAGLKRFFPLLGLMIMLVVMGALVILAVSLLIGAITAGAAIGGAGAGAGGMLLAIPLTIAMFVIAIMIAMAWFVIIPVQVVERAGAFRTLGRSAALTKHNRWRIFGIWLLWSFVSWVLQMTFTNLAGSGVPVTAGAAGEMAALQALGPVYWVVFAAFATLNTMIGGALIAVIYYELRRIKEGVGPEALASVFD